MNRATFFNAVRVKPFSGSLSQPQVSGTEAILDAWASAEDLRFTAYALATAFLETARTMLPIHEYGGPAYFKKMYDIEGDRPEKARELGNLLPGDGVRFHGRGYVQLTGRSNYRKMGDLLGVDLEDNPDYALRPSIASRIMFEGMTRGSFTGKKLADYFYGSTADWKNARRIINGLDRADEIAAYGKHFHSALLAAQDAVEPPPAPLTLEQRLAALEGRVAALEG